MLRKNLISSDFVYLYWLLWEDQCSNCFISTLSLTHENIWFDQEYIRSSNFWFFKMHPFFSFSVASFDNMMSSGGEKPICGVLSSISVLILSGNPPIVQSYRNNSQQQTFLNMGACMIFLCLVHLRLVGDSCVFFFVYTVYSCDLVALRLLFEVWNPHDLIFF